MNAGNLRHLVTIQRPLRAANAYGELITTWSDLDEVWAAITPLRGAQRLRAQEIYGAVTHRVELRYLSDVDADCRVVFGSRTFDINAVKNPSSADAQLELVCTEAVAG